VDAVANFLMVDFFMSAVFASFFNVAA